MNERIPSQVPLVGTRPHRTPFWRPPAWFLRLSLRCTVHAIARVEHELDGEFALLETTPLLEELRRLYRERDRLLRRLAGRA